MVGAGSRDSGRNIFKLLKILSLTSQYIYYLVMFAVNNIELFAENSEMHTPVTRNSSNLHLPSPNLAVFEKVSQYIEIKVYNSLPGCLRAKLDLRKHYYSFFTYTHFII
jgi:hypothetical protein